MAGFARKHHYLPRFYLAGFTDTGEVGGTLHVVDNATGKIWPSTPDGAAYQKDFYRVEHTNVEPDSLEKTFAVLEGQAARVIRTILSEPALPSGADFDVLLNFVSLMMVRIPGFRDARTDNMAQLADMLIGAALATEEQWAKAVEAMKADGYSVPETASYEQMKEFFERKEYKVTVNQNWHLRTLLEAHNTALPLLAQRDWSLLVANAATDFITSDRPVILNWTTEMPAFYPPGLGLSDTEVKMPLGKRVLLVGRFDTGSFVANIDEEMVCAANSMVALQAERRIVIPGQDFNWLKPDQSIGTLSDWLAWIKEKRRGGESQ